MHEGRTWNIWFFFLQHTTYTVPNYPHHNQSLVQHNTLQYTTTTLALHQIKSPTPHCTTNNHTTLLYTKTNHTTPHYYTTTNYKPHYITLHHNDLWWATYIHHITMAHYNTSYQSVHCSYIFPGFMMYLFLLQEIPCKQKFIFIIPATNWMTSTQEWASKSNNADIHGMEWRKWVNQALNQE